MNIFWQVQVVVKQIYWLLEFIDLDRVQLKPRFSLVHPNKNLLPPVAREGQWDHVPPVPPFSRVPPFWGAEYTLMGKIFNQPFASVIYCSMQKGCFWRGKAFEYSFWSAKWVMCARKWDFVRMLPYTWKQVLKVMAHSRQFFGDSQNKRLPLFFRG